MLHKGKTISSSFNKKMDAGLMGPKRFSTIKETQENSKDLFPKTTPAEDQRIEEEEGEGSWGGPSFF